jgi:hypothetical protein
MSKRYDYGTPINTSLISSHSDLDFDIDSDSAVPFTQPSPSTNNVSGSNSTPDKPQSLQSAKSRVYRIWHPDNLFKNVDDKDLQSITSFKSCLIKESTVSTEIRDFVAGKLLIEDKARFRIYIIKDQSKTPISDTELILPLLADDIKLAFLVDSEEAQLKTIVGASIFETGSGT